MQKLSLEKIFLLAVSLIFPMVTQAAGPTNFKSFTEVLTGIIGLLVPVLIGISLLAFLWGLTKFILAAGNEDAIADGKKLMIWGLVALFVMVSIWGIVSLLAGSFGFNFGIPQLGEGATPSTTGQCWSGCTSSGGVCTLGVPGQCSGTAICSDGLPAGC